MNLLGLDKITAKTFPIKIKLGETYKFGLLEIKALKCGITNSTKMKKLRGLFASKRYFRKSK